MKHDILVADDIATVIQHFYQKVKNDPQIGFYFSDVVPIQWDRHLKQMCLFWENILFHTGEYEGDPIETHRRVYQIHPTTTKDFEQWMKLFTGTVDALYEGKNVEKMKSHAAAIASIMMQKMDKNSPND